MEMEEDCFRKLVSTEVFAPKSAQMRRSSSDEQKISAAESLTEGKNMPVKTEEKSETEEVKVEEVKAAEPAAEEAGVAPPQQPDLKKSADQPDIKLSNDSADSSSRSEEANDSNGASHKRKVSHGSSTSLQLDSIFEQPPAKKLCPALKSEGPSSEPSVNNDVMDEEKMDAVLTDRDDELQTQLQPEPQPQPQQPAEESSPAPPTSLLPTKEEVEVKVEAAVEPEAEVIVEAVVERKTEVKVESAVDAEIEANKEAEVQLEVGEETTNELKAPAEQEEPEPKNDQPQVESKVEDGEHNVEIDSGRTDGLKSVHSDEAKEGNNAVDGNDQQPQITVTEEASSPPSPPPAKEELSINSADEETKVDAPTEDAPQIAVQPETVPSDGEKEEKSTDSIKRKRSSSSGEFSTLSNKISEEPMRESNDSAPKSPTPPPSPKPPTPPPMLSAHDLLAKAKLAKKLSQKPVSLQQLKQQARAKAIEKAIQQGKGGKKQKRKGERKSRRYQKVPPPKLQTTEAEASTNSSEEAEENVEKIVMNTGTLYLYRGENPRAEFIRRK